MNIFIKTAMGLVTFALIFYSVYVWLKSKRKMVFIILILGVLFDIAGTIFMIIGSRNISLTVHSIIGYTALSGMIIETIFMGWCLLKSKERAFLYPFNVYTWIAYGWWVITYVAGGILAMLGVGKI